MKMRKLIVAAAVGASALSGTVAHAEQGNAPKQSIGEYASDAVITTKVKAAFVADDMLNVLDIAVQTNDAIVTLTGTVGTEAETERAAQVARKVEGVKQVRNDIKIDPAKAKTKAKAKARPN